MNSEWRQEWRRAGDGAVVGLAGCGVVAAALMGGLAALGALLAACSGAALALALGGDARRREDGARPAARAAERVRRGVRLAAARMAARAAVEAGMGCDVPTCDVFGLAVREARRGRRGALLDLYLETAMEFGGEGREVPSWGEVCAHLGVPLGRAE